MQRSPEDAFDKVTTDSVTHHTSSHILEDELNYLDDMQPTKYTGCQDKVPITRLPCKTPMICTATQG